MIFYLIVAFMFFIILNAYALKDKELQEYNFIIIGLVSAFISIFWLPITIVLFLKKGLE